MPINFFQFLFANNKLIFISLLQAIWEWKPNCLIRFHPIFKKDNPLLVKTPLPLLLRVFLYPVLNKNRIGTVVDKYTKHPILKPSRKQEHWMDGKRIYDTGGSWFE